jgi:hypothetical protein
MTSSIERAAPFLFSNARLLERARFAHAFRGGRAEAVRAALLAYRNPDGGFGHALEPDVRAPESLPLHAELALRGLRAAGLRDAELLAGLCGFLESVSEASGRVPILLPGALAYPHAAHWDGPGFGAESPNPTAALVGLLRALGADHPWLERAEAWCWRRLETPPGDAHEIAAALVFLEHARDAERASALALRIAGAAAGAPWFLTEPEATGYGLTPLHLCPSPAARARRAFPEALLAAHLDALAARQQPDGGWPISFEAPSPAAALEWRGLWTLEALETLRAWGRC